MASKQSEELNTLYLGWVAALKAKPEMPLAELRQPFLDRIEEAVRKDPF